MQGLWRLWHLRARSSKKPMQGLQRCFCIRCNSAVVEIIQAYITEANSDE